MARIVAVHHPDLTQRLLDDALGVFYRVRELPGIRKRPSTSELVDWIAVLARRRVATGGTRTRHPLPGDAA